MNNIFYILYLILKQHHEMEKYINKKYKYK